jgi:hypothetical protein
MYKMSNTERGVSKMINLVSANINGAMFSMSDGREVLVTNVSEAAFAMKILGLSDEGVEFSANMNSTAAKLYYTAVEMVFGVGE